MNSNAKIWMWIGLLCFVGILSAVLYVFLYPFDSGEQAPQGVGQNDSEVTEPVQGIHPADSLHKVARKNLKQVAANNEDEKSSGSLKLQKVMDLPWGDAPGQVGRKDADESAPEGPMSFFVDDSGRVIVLDQVNSRIQIFDENQKPAVLNLPDDTYQDLSTTKDGDVVVMDRLARKDIETYGPDGKLLASVGLEGQGVEEGGGVTGLFQREDGTWVEVEHSRLVKVADMSGQAESERSVLPGRFSADGTLLLSVIKESPNSALVLVRPSDSPTQVPTSLARIQFAPSLAYITALESDSIGRVFVGAVLIQETLGSSAPPQGFEEIVALDHMGNELGRVRMPIVSGALEQFRSIRVGADGTLYWLRLGPGGAQLVRIVL